MMTMMVWVMDGRPASMEDSRLFGKMYPSISFQSIDQSYLSTLQTTTESLFPFSLLLLSLHTCFIHKHNSINSIESFCSPSVPSATTTAATTRAVGLIR